MSCHFVPPYLLQALAYAEGSADPAHTLQLDEQFRSRREAPRATVTPPSATTGGRRIIHDAGNREELPGEVARRDQDPPVGDAAVDEAWESSGQVWDLFAEEFGRQSYDGSGSTAVVTVHYGTNYDNAFWDGQQLVFGDGDGQVFGRFTRPLDVLAHEFTHGVVQFSAGLTYRGQPGALNESVADVFAALTKQRVLGQDAGDADWLIGQGLFLPGIRARALRSMLEPGTAYDDPRIGKDPQVGSMADFVETEEDNGGVHLNSGIPNRAFALTAVALGGQSWQRAGRVWYDALTAGEVGADADFDTFARATVRSAERLFAGDPAVREAVVRAWTTVGLLGGPVPVAGPAGQPSPPPAGGSDVPPEPPRTVAVRRTGGFAGTVQIGQLDLDTEPDGPLVRQLLTQVDLRQIDWGTGQPDRFVYTVQYGSLELTVPEQNLTPELSRVVQIVLGGQGPRLS
jgi:hypothetical protein